MTIPQDSTYQPRPLTEEDVGKITCALVGDRWRNVLIKSPAELSVMDEEGRVGLVLNATRARYILPEHYKPDYMRRCGRVD